MSSFNRNAACGVAKVSTAPKPREKKREKKMEPLSAPSVQTASSASGAKPTAASDKGKNSKSASQHKDEKLGRHGNSTGVPPKIGATVADCSSQPEKKPIRSTERSFRKPVQKPAIVIQTTKNGPMAVTKSKSTDKLKNSTISFKATIRDAQQQPRTKSPLPPTDNPLNSSPKAPHLSVLFQRQTNRESVLDSSAGSNSLQDSTENIQVENVNTPENIFAPKGTLPQKSSNPEQQCQLTEEDPPSLSLAESSPSELTQGPHGYVSDLDTESLISEAKRIKHELHLESMGNVSGEVKRFFEDEVKTLKHEKDVVLTAIDPLTKKIKKWLEGKHSWKWDLFKSGSHYDGTKVARVDEMDFMLVPQLFRGSLKLVDNTCLPPGFVFVEFHRSSKVQDGWRFRTMFCNEDGLVSAKLYRSHLFEILQDAVDNERRASGPQENPLEANPSDDSPSFAVDYKAIPETNGRVGLRSVSLDLVLALPLPHLPANVKENLKKSPELSEFLREIEKDGCDVVPKCCKNLHPELENRREFVWRLSLSRAEKKLTRNFDSRLEDLEKHMLTSSLVLTPPPSPPTSPLPMGSPLPLLSPPTSPHPKGSPLPLLSRPTSPKGSPSSKQSAECGRRPRPETCRKLILRYLKRLFEFIKGMDNSRSIIDRRTVVGHPMQSQHKNPVANQLERAVNHLRKSRNVKIDRFSTYTIRNLLWTKCYNLNPGIEKWTKDRVPHRLRDMLIQLRKMVAREMRVDHFFIAEMDMMSDVPKEEREFLFIMFYIAEDLLCGRSHQKSSLTTTTKIK